MSQGIIFSATHLRASTGSFFQMVGHGDSTSTNEKPPVRHARRTDADDRRDCDRSRTHRHGVRVPALQRRGGGAVAQRTHGLDDRQALDEDLLDAPVRLAARLEVETSRAGVEQEDLGL